MTMIKIALAQINPTVGDLTGNQNKIADYIYRAKKREADLVVFPEMALCGYPPEDLLHKDHFVRDNLKALRSLVKISGKDAYAGPVIIVGFVDRDRHRRLYNAAAVIRRGRLVGVYHKQHLPNYGVFDEKRYFHPGSGLFEGFQAGGDTFGLSICEDIWASPLQLKGARWHINISCSPYETGKLSRRRQLLKKRAKESRGHVIYVNLVGGQDELVFDGGSLVVDPQGKILAEAKAFEEDLLVLETGEPCQRPAPLSSIERIYKALVLGTRDYVRKSGFQKVVIGLSGGIDSAVVAAIAVAALGRENVVGVSMPSEYSSKATRKDAAQLARNLGITFKQMAITRSVRSYARILAGEFKGRPMDMTEENIQARIRGNILMALSNKFGWLVLTTGNKSEMAVGYCTLYGDMSGGFAVLKDVPKMKVYALAEFINSQGREYIPLTTIQRAPSAELRPDQKDQDSLPPYAILDDILQKYVEEHQSYARIAQKHDPRTVRQVIALVDRSEYKRRQAPPGIKITPRAFGKDWRLPIVNKYGKKTE